MKKNAFWLLLVAFLAIGTVSGSGTQDLTVVSGHVYWEGGHVPVPNEVVSMTCNSNGVKDFTNAEGFYAGNVPGCPEGSLVTACIMGESVCDTDIATDIGGYVIAYINLEKPNEPTVSPTASNRHYKSGVSTKRVWIVDQELSCLEVAHYATYQVGRHVCTNGEAKCNWKHYKNTIRTTRTC